MKLSEAMFHLEQGSRVRKKDWPTDSFIELLKDHIVVFGASSAICKSLMDDVLIRPTASQWEILSAT